MIFFNPLPKPQAITFDLDDTLYDNHPFIVEAEQKLGLYIRKHYAKSQHLDGQFWFKHKKALVQKMPLLRHDVGIMRRLVLQAGFAEIGLQGRKLQDAIDDCFDYFYQVRSDFEVEQRVKDCLKYLAGRVPLIAITNGNVDLKAIGLDDYFQVCFHASLAQYAKPDGSMFDKAQRQLNISSKAILHVGDNLTNDVYGAKKAGFNAAWLAVNRPMDLRLEKVLILPDVQLACLEDLQQLV